MCPDLPRAPRSLPPLPMGRGYVLVADDDDETSEALRRALVQEGFSVGVAHDATEALARIDARTPDAILTDICMPGGGGNALLRAVHERFPDIPVVMMSAQHQAAAELMVGGAYAYLSKPFHIDDVISVLDAALQLRPLSV